MAILANRVKINNNLISLLQAVVFAVRKSFVVLLIVLSIGMITFSVPNVISNSLNEVSGKILGVASLCYSHSVGSIQFLYKEYISVINLRTENLQLKLELEMLKSMQQSHLKLKKENAELQKLLHFVDEIKRNFITTKIIGLSSSPFASVATISAGKKNKLKPNDIVLGENGLVGRIIEVSDNYSKVMMISNHNSRIPVITASSKVKGIMTKQEDKLKIVYLGENHNARVGEIVYTSGDGQIYPKAIPVAIIRYITGQEAVVDTIENLDNIEFVLVQSVDN